MAYLPIEDHGVIGNMRTAALVGLDGTIDWLCLPHFGSPSVFASILDDKQGGSFRIHPVGSDVTYRQHYWPGTNVLVTRFLSPGGVAEIQDFMPVGKNACPGRSSVIRRVRVSRGTIEFHLRCEPVFDYAREQPEVSIGKPGARFAGSDLQVCLLSNVPLEATEQGVEARFTLEEGEVKTFVLQEANGADEACPDSQQSEALFSETVHYWRSWLAQCQYRGRWREVVHRSALALKLLTFEPTGAIVAAPTCSLPNRIRGARNWDFRFTWIRDAAFTLYALLRLGFTHEAERFVGWLDERLTEADGETPLQIMYGVDGRKDLTEIELDHLEGYRNSRPVRIGNRAHRTLQLDIYGELIDSIYLFNKYGSPISYQVWKSMRRLIDWVCENWTREDEGIWEVRNERRHFVYSKLMCWVAIDRGLRLARKRSLPVDENRWEKVRDTIYEEIIAKGWNEERAAFVQSFGSDCLDGSLLVMPLVFFMSPTDPMMLSTLDAIERPTSQGGLVADGLVYRFDTRAECSDGVAGEEGTFNMCSFWLVEALTRAGRDHPERLERARLLFERMLGYANHLGLYAEQTGASGEALGNFPQGFTHLALVSAAFNLDRALDGR